MGQRDVRYTAERHLLPYGLILVSRLDEGHKYRHRKISRKDWQVFFLYPTDHTCNTREQDHYIFLLSDRVFYRKSHKERPILLLCSYFYSLYSNSPVSSPSVKPNMVKWTKNILHSFPDASITDLLFTNFCPK